MDDSQTQSAHNLRWLVKQVPSPIPVEFQLTETTPNEWPPYFGSVYHGELTTQAAVKLLRWEGSYLIRKGKLTNGATLSFRINGSVHNYHLHYDGAYWVKSDKKFQILVDLVSDGLRVLYLNQNWHAAMTILQKKIPQQITSDTLVTYARHEFKRFIFWVKKCVVCNQVGLFTNLKCRVCGLEIHEKCVLKCLVTCETGIFGCELGRLVDLNEPKGPFILEMCIDEIERRGMDVEGLYRVSGFSEEIEALKNAFEKDGDQTDLSPETYENIHVLTGVLKKWLRMLPSPLMDLQVIEDLFQALGEKKEHNQNILFIAALKKLRPAQYATLSLLMTHLRRVINQEGNKMNSRNMALVLAPTLMPTNLINLENNIKVIEIFLKRYNLIFGIGFL